MPGHNPYLIKTFCSYTTGSITWGRVAVMSKRILRISTLITCLLFSKLVYSATVSTSFEFSIDGIFSIGTSPFTATFVGGQSQTVGNLALYHSGLFSWHIPVGNTATVTFETPASMVDFWYRDAPGASPSTVNVYDTNDALIQSFSGSQSFNNIVVNRGLTISQIKKIDFISNGGADSVADSFSFTADTPAAFNPADPVVTLIQPGTIQAGLTEIVGGITAPVTGAIAPGDISNLYIVDQAGKIFALDTTSGSLSEVADFSSKLVTLGIAGPGTFDERGLLGLAFHPDFASNGCLYVYTSEPVNGPPDFPTTMPLGVPANHQAVITEYTVINPAVRPLNVDMTSARVIIRIDEPQFNHNGGSLFFDANKFLYISLGDGGNADDEGDGHSANGNGRDPGNPLGAILRIDPLGNNSSNGQYGIPASNPFVASPELDEIFAYGLRNPYRASIDASSGTIWVADVGQNAIEEINQLIAGGHYGWNHKEGTFFFNGNGATGGTVSDVDPGGVPAGLIDPLAQYDHDDGIAVVGGYVYRGSEVSSLVGKYVFGDFGGIGPDSGRIFYLDSGNIIKAFSIGGSTRLPLSILGFAQDANGEIYVLTSETGTPFGATGKVWKITPVAQLTAAVPNVGGGGGGGSSVSWLLLTLMLLTVLLARSKPIRGGADGQPQTDQQGRFIATNEITAVFVQRKSGLGQ